MTVLFSSVEKGGWLFEYYLHSCSGYAVNELYESYMNAPDASTKSSMFVDILKKCSSHFSGWLLFHINSVGTLGRKQMFYITFVDHYFGLSRDGIELNSAIGYGVTLGMYDRERKRHEKVSKDTTVAVIQSGNTQRGGVIFPNLWLVNFQRSKKTYLPLVCGPVSPSMSISGLL